MITSIQLTSDDALREVVLHPRIAEDVVNSRSKVVGSASNLGVEAGVRISRIGVLIAENVHHATSLFSTMNGNRWNNDSGKRRDSSQSDMERNVSTKPLLSTSYFM